MQPWGDATSLVPTSPSPRYYLFAAILAGLSAFLFVVRTFLRGRPSFRSRTLVVLSVVALAAAVALFAIGWWMDVQFVREENTNSLTYQVSVRMNGTGPVTIFLPAPADTRFYPSLNATNGSSTLRVLGTPPAASVVVVAYGNVTLEVQVAVYPAGNDSFTRVASPSSPYINNTSSVSIEMDAANASTTALLSLHAWIYGACRTHYVTAETVLHTGVGVYATRYGYAFC